MLLRRGYLGFQLGFIDEARRISEQGLAIFSELEDRSGQAAVLVNLSLMAAMQGRDYVLPDDIHGIAQPVLAHRLLPNVEATMSGRSTASILAGIVESVPVPDSGRA